VTSLPAALPANTTCYCGCGKTVTRGAFFYRGHDKIAEAALTAVTVDEGRIARRLHEDGYGPDNAVIYDAVERGGWERCTEPDNSDSSAQCWYAGRSSSVRAHKRKWHRLSG
jgi:hypothetical protein